MPVLECFDRWDGPGLTNDTEFPIFLVVLFVSFVLLAVAAMAARSIEQQSDESVEPIVYELQRAPCCSWKDIIVPPMPSPPLRI